MHEHKIAQRANEEKARIKRQVANNLNHELKTPVGIIKGYLDTIISDPGMPDELRINFLKKTQAHTDRLAELLRDVSTITRLDEGASQVELTDFDFHDLAYNLANDLEISHLNGNMDFDYDIPFDCYIKANYTLVSAALLNLVKNAAAYSKGTEITLKITGEDENSTGSHFPTTDAECPNSTYRTCLNASTALTREERAKAAAQVSDCP